MGNLISIWVSLAILFFCGEGQERRQAQGGSWMFCSVTLPYSFDLDLLTEPKIRPAEHSPSDSPVSTPTGVTGL